MPVTIPTMVAVAPMRSEMREPTRTRLKTSRPRLSVPMRPLPFSRSSQAGSAEMLLKSMAMGSWGARRGPKTAMKAKRRRRKPPTIPCLCVHASPQRLLWGLRANMLRCSRIVAIRVSRSWFSSIYSAIVTLRSTGANHLAHE